MTECYCDYDGQADVYIKHIYKARKTHRCMECSRVIRPGEIYENVFIVFDGDASSCKTCPHCLGLRDWVYAHVPCFCWSHEHMLEEAYETINDFSYECPGIMFGFLRKMVAVKRAVK